MNDQRHFGVDGSLVLLAGAGTGKTHALTTLLLELLGGAGERGPVPPARIHAVTFTEKAAGELRARLRARLAGCARDATLAHEPDLRAAFERSGRPRPSRGGWEAALAELGALFVGTFHGLGGQLLRRHAAEAGLDPWYSVLGDDEQRALFDETARALVLAQLDVPGAPAQRLAREFGVGGARAPGLMGALSALHARLAEDGRDASWLLEKPCAAGELDEAAASAQLAAALPAFVAAVRGLAPHRDARKAIAEALPRVPALTAALASAPAGAELHGWLAESWPLVNGVAKGLRRALTGKGAAKDAAANVVATHEALARAHANLTTARLTSDLASLLGDVERAYERHKRRRGVVDFHDLCALPAKLVRERADVAAACQARVGALLLDEIQDANQLQLDLALSLADGVETKIFAAGDRKQSIYEFRGADVAASGALVERLCGPGGPASLRFLRVSRRSAPRLVAFANRLFTAAMGGAREAWEAPFTAGEDDLVALREAPPHDAPAAELVFVKPADSARVSREREAAAVARRIGRLLAPGAPPLVLGEDGWRAPRGGDVAILFRRLTHAAIFRRELLRLRLPHALVRGGGFYAAPEVRDLLRLARVLADAEDTISLAAVLRSPLCGASDEALVALARAEQAESGRAAIPLSRCLAGAPGLEAGDAAAIRELADLVVRLRRDAERLGAATSLSLAVGATDYRAALAAGLDGEQAVANVDKLLAMARAHEARGGTVASFALQAEALQRRPPREAEAAALEELDPRAVRLMTIHQAKGLEFPIVVVPECGVAPTRNNARVQVDRDLGVALRTKDPGGDPRPTPRAEAVFERLQRREAAQSLRLFYVAATRAKDLVLFSGEGGDGTWRAHLDALATAAPDLLARVDGDALPEPPPLAETPAAPEPRLLQLGLATGRRATPTVIASVTQLADADVCARRYLYRHVVGLDEYPGRTADDAPDADAEGTLSALDRGTLAHALLEAAPLDADAPRLLALLREKSGGRLDGASEAGREVLADAAAFLAGPLGARLRALPPRQVHRELPFVLTLPGLVVKGQVDLLFVESAEAPRAVVVDYKHSRSSGRGAERYGFQLDAYALAARELVGPALELHTGIAFLRDRGSAPSMRAARTSEELAVAGARLVEAARRIEAGRADASWPGIEQERCEAIGCGYAGRCHGVTGQDSNA